MKMTKRFTLFATLVGSALLLGACTIGQAPAATPTALNVDAIYTSAAETARVQMTDIASLATATLPATATLQSTDPLVVETPLVQVTLSVDFTPIASPDPLLVGTATGLPGLPLAATPTALSVGGVNNGPVCNNYVFEGDITIPDGTQFKAWEKFTKIWALRNTGVCTWDEGYSFRHFAGPSLAGDNYYINNKSQFVEPGQGVNMAIKMYAPGDPGEYVSHWNMFDDKGQAFGWGVTVVIKVVK